MNEQEAEQKFNDIRFRESEREMRTAVTEHALYVVFMIIVGFILTGVVRSTLIARTCTVFALIPFIFLTIRAGIKWHKHGKLLRARYKRTD